MKLPGVISFRKDLPICATPKGSFLRVERWMFDKVDEDALRRFGTEIHRVLGILGDALESLEHQVELPDVGEIMFAAGGTGDALLLDEILHFRL